MYVRYKRLCLTTHVCPEMQANEIHAFIIKHHKVSFLYDVVFHRVILCFVTF